MKKIIVVNQMEYRFEFIFYFDGDFPIISLLVYIGNFSVYEVYLTKSNSLSRTKIAIYLYKILNSLTYKQFYKAKLFAELGKDKNKRDITFGKIGTFVTLYFNKENFLDFKNILGFADWFCKINQVTSKLKINLA